MKFDDVQPLDKNRDSKYLLTPFENAYDDIYSSQKNVSEMEHLRLLIQGSKKKDEAIHRNVAFTQTLVKALCILIFLILFSAKPIKMFEVGNSHPEKRRFENQLFGRPYSNLAGERKRIFAKP